MNKPCALKFIKTIRLALMLMCLVAVSCSKEEDPAGAAGETDTTTSPSTSPGSTSSGDVDSGVGVIAPDIRRGINTQQFFIGKTESYDGHHIPYESCKIGAADLEGNHFCVGETDRRMLMPESYEYPYLDRQLFVMKTNPSGEILWVYNLNETFKQNVENGDFTFDHLGTTIPSDDIDESPTVTVKDVKTDTSNNVYVVVSESNQNITQIRSSGKGFALLKLNPQGELQWIRQFNDPRYGKTNPTLRDILYNDGGSYYPSNIFEDNDLDFLLEGNGVDFEISINGLEVTDNLIVAYGKTNVGISKKPLPHDTEFAGVLFGYSHQGDLLFVFQIPDGEKESSGGNDWYDQTNILDLKYHPNSGHYFLLAEVEDKDASGSTRSISSSVARFDGSFKSMISNHNLKSYISTISPAPIDPRAVCQKLLLDDVGNVYCAGVTNFELAPGADKGDLDEETSGNYDLFFAKIHYLGYLEWLTQVEATYEDDSEYSAYSLTDETLKDLVFDKDGNLFALGTTRGTFGDQSFDDALYEESLIFSRVSRTGEILNISQWGKDFFNDVPTKIQGHSLYVYDNSVYLAGDSMNGPGYFCDDIDFAEGVDPMTFITGILVNLDYWFEYPEKAKEIPCPKFPYLSTRPY